MNHTNRLLCRTAVLVVLVAALSACSSSRFASTRTSAPPEQLTPITSSSVQGQALPPLSNPDGSLTTATSDDSFASGDPALLGTQQPDGTFVSLDDVGSTTTGPGRNLSGGVTVAKLLGVWTVVAGSNQCRLNLTQTTKSGTNRYRASTPGCTIPTLSGVASWQLAGTQVQLYDEGGAIIGSLLQSGNRFIGTLTGGIAMSMVG